MMLAACIMIGSTSLPNKDKVPIYRTLRRVVLAKLDGSANLLGKDVIAC